MIRTLGLVTTLLWLSTTALGQKANSAAGAVSAARVTAATLTGASPEAAECAGTEPVARL